MKITDLLKRAKKMDCTDFFSKNILKEVIVNGTGYKFRPVQIHHKGSNMRKGWSYSDSTNSILKTLKRVGIKYKVGNDAPRGGRTGAFIEVQTKISSIREKSLKDIPLDAIRVNGDVYARITDSSFQNLYRIALNKNFPIPEDSNTILSTDWFKLNEKTIPYVKVRGIEEAGVVYFKEFTTDIIFYSNNPCTYFIILKDDKELACNTIGVLLKKYGFSFELDKENWRIKNNKMGLRYKSNIHPSIYDALRSKNKKM